MAHRYFIWSIVLTLGIFLIALTNQSKTLASQDVQFERILKGSFIIVEGMETTPLNVLDITSDDAGEIHFEIDGEATFADGSKKQIVAFSGPSKIAIPSVKAGPLQDESFITIQIGNNQLKPIRVFTTKPEWFEIIGANPEVYQDAIELKSDSFAVINEPRLDFTHALSRREHEGPVNQSLSKLSSSTASNDAGASAIISDDGSVTYPKSLCVRTYIPYAPRIGFGILNWKIETPGVWYSLKDENVSSDNAASLRCPLRYSPSTEYYVDGVYRTNWTNPVKAFKIPNHCTVTRYAGYFYSCCNVLGIPTGGISRYINPRDNRNYPGWPDGPKRCQ
jgi:hypothetical protein